MLPSRNLQRRAQEREDDMHKAWWGCVRKKGCLLLTAGGGCFWNFPQGRWHLAWAWQWGWSAEKTRQSLLLKNTHSLPFPFHVGRDSTKRVLASLNSLRSMLHQPKVLKALPRESLVTNFRFLLLLYILEKSLCTTIKSMGFGIRQDWGSNLSCATWASYLIFINLSYFLLIY